MEFEDRYQRVNLRIPKDLHAKVMEAAEARSHSMNAEIVQRLGASLASEEQQPRGLDLGELSVDETVLLAILRECEPKVRESFMTLARSALKVAPVT